MPMMLILIRVQFDGSGAMGSAQIPLPSSDLLGARAARVTRPCRGPCCQQTATLGYFNPPEDMHDVLRIRNKNLDDANSYANLICWMIVESWESKEEMLTEMRQRKRLDISRNNLSMWPRKKISRIGDAGQSQSVNMKKFDKSDWLRSPPICQLTL